MTLDAQPSTSSAETENSKLYPVVVILGMRIVRELGLEDSFDTLGRWMSHRISELMERVDQSDTEAEKEEAKRECTDLILKVWERRRYWPKGQPLDDLSKFLNNVTLDHYSTKKRESLGKQLSWIEALPCIRDLQKREDKIVLDAAIADLNLDKEREWLEEHPGRLTDKERQTIIWLIGQQERLQAKYYQLDTQEAPNFLNTLTEERARLALSALDKIKEERQKIFAAVSEANGISLEGEAPPTPQGTPPEINPSSSE